MSDNTDGDTLFTSITTVKSDNLLKRVTKLSSIHDWNENCTFYLHESGGVVERICYSDGNDTMIECDFTNFLVHAEIFFKFFGIPDCVQADNGESILSILDRLMNVKIPETCLYAISVCGCNMGHCDTAIGYEKNQLNTIGEFLRLVGREDWNMPEYKYAYPDRLCLYLEPFTEQLEVHQEGCYSNNPPKVILDPESNAYTFCYSR